jgi:hypothetical protein
MTDLNIPEWVDKQIEFIAHFNQQPTHDVIQEAIIYYLHHNNFGPILGQELSNIERRVLEKDV